jgi:hypothetical protein
VTGNGRVPFIFLALPQNLSAKSSRSRVGVNNKFHFYKKRQWQGQPHRSVISYQLSVISDQLSVISYQ